MKRMWIPTMRGGLAAWMLVVVLAVAVVGTAWAGVEPSPWKPGTNVLNAVSGVLGQVNQHLDEVLGIGRPPNPCSPEGQVGKLNAMTNQLSAQQGRVEAVLTVVPPVASEPPQEFLDALNNVREGAVGIARDAEAGIGTPSDALPDTPDPVQEALWGVYNAAWDVIDTVDGYLEAAPSG